MDGLYGRLEVDGLYGRLEVDCLYGWLEVDGRLELDCHFVGGGHPRIHCHVEDSNTILML